MAAAEDGSSMADQELSAARADLDRAYRTYTRLITGADSGEVDAARTDYARALARLRALEAAAARHPPKELSSPLEQDDAEIGAAGGMLALPGGARLEFPAGALAQPTRVTFQRLPEGSGGVLWYRVEAGGRRLAKPARLTLPIPAMAGRETIAVDILHLHGDNDLGNVLRSDWQPGRTVATIQLDRFSLIGMLITRGGLTGVGVKFLYDLYSNTPEAFMASVKAALAASRVKDIRLSVPPYHQHNDKTMWCWAAAMTMAVQATRSIDAGLNAPLKPHHLAAWGGYDQSGGPGGVQWAYPGGGILGHLRTLTGAEVEGRYWPRYPELATYIIEQLGQGHIVLLDLRSVTHTIALTGFDDRGLWALDPANRAVPVHDTWETLFTVLNSKKYVGLPNELLDAKKYVGLHDQAPDGKKNTGTPDAGRKFIPNPNNFALTTVIKRRPPEGRPPFTLNVPSCEWAYATGMLNGVHFKGRKAGDAVGFRWDGRVSGGLALVGGTPGEPRPVEQVTVDGATRLGLAKLDIGNGDDRPHRFRLRASLLDTASGEEGLLHDHDLGELGANQIHIASLPDLELLPVLPRDRTGIRDVRLRLSLLVDGNEVDRLDIPFRLAVLRLDEVDCAGGRLNVRGSGFSLAPPRLAIETAGQTFELMGQAKSDSLASFDPPDVLTQAGPLRVSIRLKDTRLESNALPLTNSGCALPEPSPPPGPSLDGEWTMRSTILTGAHANETTTERMRFGDGVAQLHFAEDGEWRSLGVFHAPRYEGQRVTGSIRDASGRIDLDLAWKDGAWEGTMKMYERRGGSMALWSEARVRLTR